MMTITITLCSYIISYTDLFHLCLIISPTRVINRKLAYTEISFQWKEMKIL